VVISGPRARKAAVEETIYSYALRREPGCLETLELPVVRMAHSHSVSQFRRHLPQHWNSIMLPPHCGQTKLMIEEIMLELGSPGIVSIILIVAPFDHVGFFRNSPAALPA
jgi:hypothetical protein